MRRYPLVIAGTVAGAAGVLAFPLHKASTVVASSPAGSTTTPATSPTTTPTTTPAAGTTPTTAPTSSSTAAPATTRTATGADESFQFGDLAVKVTVSGRKITDVTMASLDAEDRRSESIDSYAIPQLEQQAIDAGSAHIDGVSGATFTSQAFADSLASALGKLGIS